MKLITRALCFLLGLTVAQRVVAALSIVNNGRSDYRIVVAAEANAQDLYAAKMLADYVEKISTARLVIVRDSTPPKANEIVIGFNGRVSAAGITTREDSLGKEEFRICTKGDRLFIIGGAPRGVIYGVNSLLVDVWNCRWFTPELVTIPHQKTLVVPQLDIRYKPPFEWRRPHFYAAHSHFGGGDWKQNAEWNFHHFMNCAHAGVTAEQGGTSDFNGYKWHTFFDVVPPARYFDAHPEYFSLRDGQRIDGRKAHSQLCSTNRDLPRLFADAFLKRFSEAPHGGTIFSVSQNDYPGWCECGPCKALDDEYGSRAASQLVLANRVAERLAPAHPDWRISILSYGFSQVPPKKPIRIHPNVLVLYANYSVCRLHSLTSTDCSYNQEFRTFLRRWLDDAQHVYVWLYVENDNHFYFPNPTIDNLAKDFRFLRDQAVKGVFLQGSGFSPDGDMIEMRAYLGARLMWNPDLDPDQLRREFFEAYYGKAALVMDEYRREIRQAFLDHNAHFVLGTKEPRHYAAVITNEMLARWYSLLDRAGSLAEDDVKRRHVRKARLTLVYTEGTLEQDPARKRELLERFVREAGELNIQRTSFGTGLQRFARKNISP